MEPLNLSCAGVTMKTTDKTDKKEVHMYGSTDGNICKSMCGSSCWSDLILYSKKKDREDAQNAGAGGSHDTNSAESQNAAASHMTCSGDCSKCYSHCSSEKKNL